MSTAFVLAGGGAKGSFQVGVLKKLLESGIKPDAIWGTSVGAINAAAISYSDVNRLEQVWRGIKGNNDIIKFQLGTVFFATRGIYSTSPLKKLLTNFIDGFPTKNIHPHVCMTNLFTGQIVYVDPWNCSLYGMTFDEAVLASASLPLAMEPVNNVWVDGGVRETVPLKEAVQAGYKEIYVVLCNPWQRDPKPKREIANWLSAGIRTLDLLTHEIFINDVQTCLKCNDRDDKKTVNIHLYAPSELAVDTLDFDPEQIAKGIEKGYNSEEISHDFIREL